MWLSYPLLRAKPRLLLELRDVVSRFSIDSGREKGLRYRSVISKIDHGASNRNNTRTSCFITYRNASCAVPRNSTNNSLLAALTSSLLFTTKNKTQAVIQFTIRHEGIIRQYSLSNRCCRCSTGWTARSRHRRRNMTRGTNLWPLVGRIHGQSRFFGSLYRSQPKY
jgi:hypothetical protein